MTFGWRSAPRTNADGSPDATTHLVYYSTRKQPRLGGSFVRVGSPAARSGADQTVKVQLTA
jgi:hypothetical protein